MGVVVVTGTSSGIGLATSVHFARRGHQVFATIRDLSRSQALEKAAADAGVGLAIRQLDVDDDGSVRFALDGIASEAGRIDALVNNAGVLWMRPWEEAPMEEIEQTFQTNLFGAVRCTKAVLPTMRGQGSGAIVNVASIGARVGAPIQGPYCAAKFALAAFTESVAIEVRSQGITVAAVLPGFVSTPILERSWEGYDPDAGGPYRDLFRRWAALYSQAREVAADPQGVADAIERVVDTGGPMFQFVGADAEVLAAGRATMTDADWLAFGDEQTDEEWFARFARHFPLPA